MTRVALAPAPPLQTPVALDPSQLDALAAARTDGAVVLGAAGTGKTTLAAAVLADAIERGVDPSRALLIASNRRVGAKIRDSLAGLGVTASGPLARTSVSLAFAILAARARLADEPVPTLITGPEQDAIFAELLAGHAAGDGVPIDWPPWVSSDLLGLPAFRAELRDLFFRCGEHGIGPAALARIGVEEGRAEWTCAARLFQEYLDVDALRGTVGDASARLEFAVTADEAIAALRTWPAATGAGARPAWDLIVVDDYQDATAATARLLGELASGGARLVLLGDPDTGTQGYRGGDPGLLRLASEPPPGAGRFGLRVCELAVSHRQAGDLADASARVTARIRAAVPGRRHRVPRPTAQLASGHVLGAVLASPTEQCAYIAHWLRRAHLIDRVPWSELAVIARSGALVDQVRAALADAGVPVATPVAETPVRDEPAARPLLLAMRCAAAPEALDGAAAATLLASPLGGLDSLDVRRLRRRLLAIEAAAGGTRGSDELLIGLLVGVETVDELPKSLGQAVGRLVQCLEAGRAAAAAPGADASDVLWAIWDASGLADAWRELALAGGAVGQRADADLDAVIALFAEAQRFSERVQPATSIAFDEHLAGQELPSDTLAASAGDDERVVVATPASAAGGAWRRVAIPGLQEGVWPDLRVRDAVLGAGALVDIATGRASGGDVDPIEARRAVLDDELRTFAAALSRASDAVLLTAVLDTEEQPSAFLSIAAPSIAGDRVTASAPAPLDLRGMAGAARRRLERPEEIGVPLTHGADLDENQAAALLAVLADAGVAGADPASWIGLAPRGSDRLHADDEVVTLSPSRIESILDCPLRWALETAGGRRPSSTEQTLGTLIHELAEKYPSAGPDELAEALDERWRARPESDSWIEAQLLERAKDAVAKLGAYQLEHPGVLATEANIDVTEGNVRLLGRVDRVETVGGGKVRIVDFKTSRTALSKADAEANPQLAVYQHAIDAGGLDDALGAHVRSAGAELVYIATSAQSAAIRPQAPLAERADEVAALIAQARSAVGGDGFTARGNKHCGACPVRRNCPLQEEGQAVTQ